MDIRIVLHPNEAAPLDQRYQVLPGNETTRNKQMLN
jgi:hypothetical protein